MATCNIVAIVCANFELHLESRQRGEDERQMKIARKKDDVDAVVTESDFTTSLSENRYTHFVCIYRVSTKQR